MLSTGSINGFPADDVPKSVKKKTDYGQLLARAIYGRWYSAPIPYGSGGTVYGNLAYFNVLKAYAEGRQSPLKYKKLYRGENNKGGNAASGYDGYGENARKGYNNIGFDQNSIVTTAPAYISTIKSLLTTSDYKVVVKSTSQSDIQTKEKMKAKKYIDSKFIQPVKKELGIPFKASEWQPQSKAELEIYERYYGFRLPLETGLSMIAEHAFDTSKWPKLRDKMLDAAIQTAFICGRIRPYADGSVRVEYINPAMFITVWDDDNPDEEPPFAGHIERVSIQKIRQKMSPEQISDKQLEGIARMYASTNNVADPTVYNWTTKDPVTGRYAWYDFYIDVLHFECKSDDAKHYVARTANNGNYVYKEEDKPKKDYADGRERRTDTYYEQNVYEGSWIINTQYIYDYGLQKNIIRNPDGSACLSYFAERIAGRSIIERWQTLLDDMQMATLKLRAAVMAAAPKGLMIDVGLLANMDLGQGKMTALEIARIRRETGNQFYVSRFDLSSRANPANAMQELENGIGKQLDEWINYMLHVENQMMKVAGLSPSSVASPTASPEKLVGLAQMELESTNNALYSIKYAIMNIKQKAAEKVIRKVRLLVEIDPKSQEYYCAYLGDMFYNAVKSSADLSLEKIGIKMQVTTTAQRKQMIMNAMSESLKAGKNGQIGITSADFMYIEKTLEEGYDELASWYLALAEERAARKIQENQERMSALNAENGAKAAQVAAEAKAQTEQLLSKLRQDEQSKKIADQLEADLAIQYQKHLDIMEELKLEGAMQASMGKEITGRI